MKIYTKKGDSGTTSLFSGEKVTKSSPRVELYGTVDEINAAIGLALSLNCPETLKMDLAEISKLLFTFGADLATPSDSKNEDKIRRIDESDVEFLEKIIDKYDEELPPLKNFVLPGGTGTAGALHLARTICRRAERLAVKISESENIRGFAVKFLNRLSDCLFTASRMANHLEGKEDILW